MALGGTAYAANTIRSSDIVNGQVKRVDLANNAVTSAKVKDRSLRSKDFKAGELPKGDPGPKGDKGDRGPAGPNGDKGDTGPSTGPAGGVLSGNYPNPSFAADVDRLIPVAVVYVTARGPWARKPIARR